MSKPVHDVSLMFHFETEKAVSVSNGIRDDEGRYKKLWLPKSQIETEVAIADMEPNKAYTFTVPQWLLEEKGLEYE